MEWVTTTAKTLPEAIDLALDNLGVDESEAEIVVLEEPSKGLFGRVRGTARVEARVKPKAIRPKADRGRNRRGRSDNKSRGDRGRRGRPNDRGGRSSNNNGDDAGGGGGGRRGGGQSNRRGSTGSQGSDRQAEAKSNEKAEETKAGEASSGDTRKRSRSDSQPSSRDRSGSTGAGPDSGSGEGGSSRGRRRSKKSGSGSSGSGGSGNGGRDTKHDKKTADNKQKETPVEEVAEHLRSFLGGLTEAFGLEGDVDIDTSETDVMVATVKGQHGLMVGPKGRTLDAIQELARVSSQRAAPSSIRIRVDVGGYRKQRAAALGDFARKAADKAVDNGVEVALEPMSPADRKSVHDALVEDDRVETRSVGTEPRRKVVVIPVSGGSADDSEEE